MKTVHGYFWCFCTFKLSFCQTTKQEWNLIPARRTVGIKDDTDAVNQETISQDHGAGNCSSSEKLIMLMLLVSLSQGVSDSLGVSIAGGKGSPLGDIPIFVAMIQASGVAAKTHRLKVTVWQLQVSHRDLFMAPFYFLFS